MTTSSTDREESYACHTCGATPIGQCKRCQQCYCKNHGEVICEDCSRPSSRGVSASGVLVGHGQDSPVLSFESNLPTRIVPVLQRQVKDGIAVSISDVELYDAGFMVSYRIRRIGLPGAIAKDLHTEPKWTASDNVGTAYIGDMYDLGEYLLVPAPPSHVEEVGLALEQITWYRTGNFEPESTDIGPWRFEIPLA